MHAEIRVPRDTQHACVQICTRQRMHARMHGGRTSALSALRHPARTRMPCFSSSRTMRLPSRPVPPATNTVLGSGRRRPPRLAATSWVPLREGEPGPGRAVMRCVPPAAGSLPGPEGSRREAKPAAAGRGALSHAAAAAAAAPAACRGSHSGALAAARWAGGVSGPGGREARGTGPWSAATCRPLRGASTHQTGPGQGSSGATRRPHWTWRVARAACNQQPRGVDSGPPPRRARSQGRSHEPLTWPSAGRG